MVTTRRLGLAVVVAVLCALPGSAFAWPMHTNQRVDRMLRDEHPERVVLAGRIVAHLQDVLDLDPPGIVPGLQHVVFAVDLVLLGGAYAVGDHLRFSTRDIERLFAAQLAAAIAEETSVHRLRDLVKHATPVLSAEQAEAVLAPWVESEDEWLRHAVIAGLAYASPTAPNIERALADLRAFIQRTPAGAKYSEDSPTEDGSVVRYACDAYGMLFAGYSILQSDWKEPEFERLRPLLPLYRLIAAELGKEPFQHWNRGIEPLCRLGDAADVPVLYAYYRARAARAGGAFPWTAGVRFAVMRQLAAWLEVEVVAWSDGTTMEREAEQMVLLEAAYATYLEDGGD